MKCPNVNHPEYKKMSEAVGPERAHQFFAMNNGNYLSQNKDGSSSETYNYLQGRFDTDTAIRLMSLVADVNNPSINDIVKRANPAILKAQMSTRTQNFVSFVTDKIQAAFPSFSVNFVVDEDVIGTGNENKRGWVKDGTINYNLDRISLDTLVHEPFHIYLWSLSERNPEQLKKLRNEASLLLDEENALAIAVKEANNDLTRNELLDEIIATIAGISGKKSLLDVIGVTGKVKNHNDLDEAWNKIEDTIGETIDITKSFFKDSLGFDENSLLDGIDFQNSAIFQIGQAFARDVMSGNLEVSPEEADVAYRASFFQTANQKDLRLQPPILKSKDFIGYLNDGSNRVKSLDSMSDDAMAEYFLTHRDLKKNVIYVNGEEISLLASDRGALLEEIKNKVLPLIKEFEASNKDNLKGFLNDIIGGAKFQDSLEKYFKREKGGYRYSPRSLMRLTNIIGMGSAASVMYYSDLKDSNNTLLKNLYDPSFVGYDPLVVIHQVENSKGKTTLDVSVLDVTSMPLGLNGTNLKGRNLFSSIMSDRKAYTNGTTMTNSDGDFRKLSVGLTMMSMKQKMMALSGSSGHTHDVRFRGLGVVGLYKKNFDARLLSDSGDLIRHIRQLTQTPIMDRVENANLRAVLENEALYEADYDQSFVAMMQQYLAEKALSKNYIDRRHFKTMLDGDPDSIIEMLQSRQEYLERQHLPEQLKMNDEYTLISGAILELKYGIRIEKNSLRDMVYPAKWGTSTHNVRSMILQHIIRTANTTSEKVYDATNADLQPFREGLKKYKKLYQMANPESGVKQFVLDHPSKYYEHLFKKKVLPTNTADGIGRAEVIIPELHWDISDPDTKEALMRGQISNDDIKWAKMVADKIEETYIDNIYHKNRKEKYDGKKFTREEAKRLLYESGFKKGMVPVIRKSVNERLFDGDVKGGMSQFGDQMARYHDEFGDDLVKDDEFFSQVTDRYANAMKNERNLERAGLAFDQGNLSVIDLETNSTMSTNLEKILGYFFLSSNRKIKYEQEVLPLVNNANMMMMWLSQKGLPQDNNQQYLKEYIDRLVHMKTQDTNEKLKILGHSITLNQAMNTGLKTVGFLAMGYRPWLGVKSHVYNELQGWMTSFANSIAKNDYFTAKDYLKAHNIVFTDYKKAEVLANKMHLTNGDEGDLVNNPFKTITNRNLGKSQFSNIANFMSDIYARRVVMVAQMLHEGSWDAYTYNEESGDVDYDEKNDRRMYDESGKLTEQGKAIRNFIKDKLIEDGLMDKDSDVLPRGHDYQSGQLFKYLSDKYVIGSMDNKSRSMLGNHYFGRAMGQFRLFSVDKLFNWGVDADTRESIFGGVIKATKDKDGNWVAEREMIEIEGQLQSLGAAIKTIRSMDAKKMSEFWAEAGPVRRANLARLAMKTAFSMMLIALIRGLFDDDETMQQKFAWIYSDLMDSALAYETIINPAPIVSQMKRLVDITMGHKDVSGLKKFIPGYSAYDDFVDGYKMYKRITE